MRHVISKAVNKSLKEIRRRVETQVFFAFSFYITVVALASLGYFFLEGLDLRQSIYYGLTAFIGAGFEFKNPIAAAITGAAFMAEWVSLWFVFEGVVQFIAEGRLKEMIEAKQVSKAIIALKGHYIVCGGGRVGEEIAGAIKAKGKQVVMVDKDSTICETMMRHGFLVVQGDVSEEETFQLANIQKARSLVAALGSDMDNVFATLTAKNLNPSVHVVARAEKKETVKKLKQAGADEVVMPSAIGGRAMADAVLRV